MKAQDILDDLLDKAKGADRPNMKQLTVALKAAKFPYGSQHGRGWYAKKL
jgi:hypothetical protein